MKTENRRLKAALGSVLIAFSFFQTSLPLAAAEHHGQVKFGGLAVPGATVTATQGDKKVSVITEKDGSYSFPDLAEGNWTLSVDMLGFAPAKLDATVTPTAVVGASAPSPDIELKMLALDEMKASSAGTVVVGLTTSPSTTAPAAASNASGANRNNAPRNNSKQAVPAASSQAGFQRTEARATTAPGTPAQAAAADPAPAPEATAELAQRAQDGFLVNGSSVNGASSQFAFNPAIGNNRRGARSLYNGNVGFNLNNSALNARSYSFTGFSTPKPESTQFTGMASFGGPFKIPHIVKNGPNFTLNYQWTRNSQANTGSGLLPTEEERKGNFAGVTNAFGQPVQILDPVTHLPIPGNQLQPTQISSQATSLLSLFPHPNVFGNPAYNYQIAWINPTHGDSLQARAGKQLGRKNNLNWNFGLQSNRSDNTNLFGFLDTSRSLGFNAGASVRHQFTTRHYGTIGLQYSRQSNRSIPFFENRSNISGLAGIGGNNQESVNWGPPSLSFQGSGISGLNDGTPSFNRNQTITVNYDGTWTRGRHSIGYGGDYRWQQFNALSQQNPRGSFTFSGLNTGVGYDWAGFLMGVPDTSSLAFGNADKYFRASGADGYLNDDFRLSGSVSMQFGVRWVYSSPVSELYGRLVNLDIAPGFSAVAPVVANSPVGSLTGAHYPGALMNGEKGVFDPRIGVAWRPISGDSLLLRAGYGVSHDTSVYQSIASQMAQQSPLSKSLSLGYTALDPLSLANGFNALPSSTPNTFAVDPNFRIGYAQQWQLSLQRDLPAAMQMVATYTGIKGTRGGQQFIPNTFPQGITSPCPSCPTGFYYLTSNGNSTREAGSLQLRRRLQRGFTASLLYTYSKSIDDSSLGGGGGGLIAQNWLNLSAERGLSAFDQRHVLNFSVQYTSGLGIGGGILTKGWRGALLKEWSFVSNLTLGSGTPLSPTYNAAVQGTGFTGTVRPDYVGGDIYNAPDGKFLNQAAFRAPAAGQWGNAGRNSIIGPDKFTLSAQMSRTFRMSDRLSLDVGIQSNNPINRVTVAGWGTNITSPQFGVPTAGSGMRSVLLNVRMRF